jgi:hypothetical protein
MDRRPSASLAFDDAGGAALIPAPLRVAGRHGKPADAAGAIIGSDR